MARKFKYFIVFGAFVWILWSLYAPPLPSQKHPIKVYQTRSDLKRCALRLLKSAKESILIEMYGLTDRDLIGRLQRKKIEGVEVTILCDPKGTGKLPMAKKIKGSGLMHRKIVVVDGATSFFGTANFTPASLKMHGNTMIGVYSPPLAEFLSQEVKTSGRFDCGNTSITAFLLPDFKGKALSAILRLIESSQESIEVSMFTLTHPKLVDALCRAAERGVAVHISIDHYTAKGASKKAVEQLEDVGIEISLSEGPTLYHHKCALIDHSIFVLGSANWTQSAFSKNWDCLFIFENLPEKILSRVDRMKL